MNDAPMSLYGLHQTPRNAPPVNGIGEFGPLSPSARALRSHEPGQSLPKGLAAGLSRLHLVPATGQGSTLHDMSPDGSRVSGVTSQLSLKMAPIGRNGANGSQYGGGFETQRSGLTSPTRGGGGGMGAVNGGMRQPWVGHPTLSSPLSRPLATNDIDDGLFPMDDPDN